MKRRVWIVRIFLLLAIAVLGTGSSSANKGVLKNSCSVVMTQIPFNPELLKYERVQNSSSAMHLVNACPVPYVRTGATCTANALSGLLRVAGTDTDNNGRLFCRGTVNSSAGDLEVELRSYPICMKVELVCK